MACDAAFFEVNEAYNVYNQIKEYKEKHIRWFYSDISNFIFGLDNPGGFLSNIEELQDYADNFYKFSACTVEEQNTAKDLVDFIDKLWDHASLAQQQKAAFLVNKKDLSDTVVEKLKPEVNKMENGIRKELISLIGIFTALSFLVFGGISSLDNIFDGAKSIPILQVLIIGSIWGLCMFNLIFVFVFFIAKLTDLQLSSVSDKKAKFSQRYPEWAWGNLIMCTLLAIVSWLYFIDYSNTGSWLIVLARHNPALISIAGIILVFAVAWLIGRRIAKNHSLKES